MTRPTSSWRPPPPPTEDELARRRHAWENILKLCDADSECPHGRLPLDKEQACGCWHEYRLRLIHVAAARGVAKGLTNF